MSTWYTDNIYIGFYQRFVSPELFIYIQYIFNLSSLTTRYDDYNKLVFPGNARKIKGINSCDCDISLAHTTRFFHGQKCFIGSSNILHCIENTRNSLYSPTVTIFPFNCIHLLLSRRQLKCELLQARWRNCLFSSHYIWRKDPHVLLTGQMHESSIRSWSSYAMRAYHPTIEATKA